MNCDSPSKIKYIHVFWRRPATVNDNCILEASCNCQMITVSWRHPATVNDNCILEESFKSK